MFRKMVFSLLVFCAALFVWSQDISKIAAHSVADWDAAGTKGVPPQGFRNWSFGCYDKPGDPNTFRPLRQGAHYWGDGNFTDGAISRNTITWSTGPKKADVVRRWTVPENGNFSLSLEGTHVLKVKGEEVTWPRKLTLYVNGESRQVFSFPGKRILKKELCLTLKKGDKIDFAAQSWGGSLHLTIIIRKMEKGLPVVMNGQSAYSIVVPDDDPGKVSARAAQLLQRVVTESTGAKLPIVRDSLWKGNAPAIHIGKTRKALQLQILPENAKEEEYAKKIVGTDIFLRGTNAQTEVSGKKSWRPGDYKAVCSFLEDELGARFLLPGKFGEEIPKRSSWVLPLKLDVRHCPPFPYHITSHSIQIARESYEPYITAANSINRNDMRYFYGHSWESAVNAKTYGKTHPEYFVLLGGVRHPEKIGNQLCIGNTEVQALIQKHIEDSFAMGYQYYQLSQSDAFVSCECSACKALGTPSERVWNFHRSVAEAVYKKYPKQKINILAYEITQEPPSWIKNFPPNVIIELTKYDEVEFRKWEKYHVPFMVYDYNWGVYHELGFLPKRTPKRLADQLRRFHRFGVVNIFNDGFPTSFTGLEATAGYVYNKLLDDLSLNPDLLAEDYCRASFGENAGPVMYSFFSALYKHLESFPENAYFTTDDPWLVRSPESMIATHFPPGSIQFMEAQLTKAEQFPASERQKMRLKNVRLHFNYCKSVVKAFAAFRTFQLTPVRPVFQLVCDALREREQAIDAILKSDLPAAWKGYLNKNLWLAGGSLSGILGAPFTWNYQEMEKNGTMPMMKTKDAKAYRFSVAPKLDGPQWNKLPVYPLEKVSGGKADLSSSFQIGYDAQNIYVHFRAETPGLAQKKFASVGKENYIPTECFDVFVNPTGLSDRYYQFIFSPAPDSCMDGAMNIGRFGADPQWNKLDVSWNGNWQYAFRLHPERNEWTAMLTIPVSSLGTFRPGPGKFMTMNVGRVNGNKLFLWSPNTENQKFGNTLAFGQVQFE